MQAPKFGSFKSKAKQAEDQAASRIVNHKPNKASNSPPSAPFAYTVSVPKRAVEASLREVPTQAKPERSSSSRPRSKRERSPETESSPRDSTPLESASSNLYIIDRTGDWQNLKYGRSGKVPAYRRRAMHVLGLGPQFIAEGIVSAEGLPTASKTEVGYTQTQGAGPRPSLRQLPQETRRLLRSSGAPMAQLADFVPLNTKASTQSVQPMKRARPAFMLHPSAQDKDESESDGLMSDEEVYDVSNRKLAAELSSRVEAHPSDEEAWLRYAKLQDDILAKMQQDGSALARQGAAKVKVTILQKAINANPGNANLALAYMKALTVVADRHELQAAFKGILDRVITSASMWCMFLDHLETRFHDQYTLQVAELKEALVLLQSYHQASQDIRAFENMARVFRGLLQLYMRYGYIELAVAHVQAMSQMILTDRCRNVDACKSWWDEESERFGEKSDIVAEEDTARPEIETPTDVVEQFVQAELQAMAVKPALRISDDSAAENDPYATVLSDDLTLFNVRDAPADVQAHLLLDFLSLLGFHHGLIVDHSQPTMAYDLLSLFLGKPDHATPSRLTMNMAWSFCTAEKTPLTQHILQELQVVLVAYVFRASGYQPAGKNLVRDLILRSQDGAHRVWAALIMMNYAHADLSAAALKISILQPSLDDKDNLKQRERFVLQALHARLAHHARASDELRRLLLLSDDTRARAFVNEHYDDPEWSSLLFSLTTLEGLQALHEADLSAFMECYDVARTRVSLNYKVISRLAEQLYQLQLAQLQSYMETNTVRPSVLRDLLHQAILECPTNPIFFKAFRKHEERFGIAMRSWKLQGALLASTTPPSAATLRNIMMLEICQAEKHGSAVRVRALERLLSLEEEVISPAREELYYTLLQSMAEDAACDRNRIRDCLFEALSHVTSKRLLLLAFSELRRHLSPTDFRAVHELMLSRGLRVVDDLDDYFDEQDVRHLPALHSNQA